MKQAVRVKHLSVAYGSEPVLFDVSVAIPEGVICAVVGPNGAGKTTFIKALLHLLQPVAGVIEILGTSYQDSQKLIAYVPQRSTVDWDFPISVLDVVVMGRFQALGWFKRPQPHDYSLAQRALALVNLSGYEQRPISELSGGERQRVFLARALVQDAPLYIMDEPFVGVDAVTEKTIVDVLKNLRNAGKTIIVVHHDLQTMQEYFDWMVVLNRVLVASGPLQDVFTAPVLEKAYGALPHFFAGRR